MKGLLFNLLLGLGLGRFSSVWGMLVFLPALVAAELAVDALFHHLSALACLRRGAALLICSELAFLLGMLMRPLQDEK